MQYQDPLEPTDNTEYISQLATFSQLEEMQNLNQSLTEGSAYNLVGKYVFVKVTNNQTGETSYDHGMVEYVMRENGKVYISVNDIPYQTRITTQQQPLQNPLPIWCRHYLPKRI